MLSLVITSSRRRWLLFLQQPRFPDISLNLALTGNPIAVFGDGDSDPRRIVQHFFELRQGFISLGIPVIAIGTVKDVDIVVALEILILDDAIDQFVGRGDLRPSRYPRIVVGMKILHLLGLGIMEDKPGCHLVFILIDEP